MAQVWREPELVCDDLRWYGGDPLDVLDALAKIMLAAKRPWWHRHAACRGMNPELFFPGQGSPPKAARDACAGCTVRSECHQWAVEHGEEGFWAGTSPRERRLREASPVLGAEGPMPALPRTVCTVTVQSPMSVETELLHHKRRSDGLHNSGTRLE